ncbi:MAG: polysaccharide deacetylase family protein [Bryobacteraceae bacterium]
MLRAALWLILSLVCARNTSAQRQIAITIDDLPRGGDTRAITQADQLLDFTRRFLEPLKAAGVPFTGFVNEGRRGLSDSDLRAVLSFWLDAGAELGNHTHSHPDLNQISLERFEDEVRRGERITRPLAESKRRKYRYFRHPFLHTGLDMDKRRGSEAILKRLGYTIAPVTIDNSDYLYAQRYQQALDMGDTAHADRIAADYLRYMDEVTAFFERRSLEVTGREPAQILLIHANHLNGVMMPRLLDMFRKRGYRIVPLEAALQDKAYQLPDTYVGPQGISWIHRWARAKGMPDAWEPDPPKWLTAER